MTRDDRSLTQFDVENCIFFRDPPFDVDTYDLFRDGLRNMHTQEELVWWLSRVVCSTYGLPRGTVAPPRCYLHLSPR